MGRNIANTELFEQLLKLERAKTDITPISSVIAQHLQNTSEFLLGEIGTYMPNYTLHNIDHVVNVLDIINDIVPDKVKLNRSELTLLIYAVALHDMGMLINRDDAEQLKGTEEYRHLLAEFDKDTPEGDILSELIRRTHVDRSCEYIDKFKANLHLYHLDFEIDGIDFRKHLKNIILAHALPVSKLTDDKYPTNALIGKERVNVKFLALLLRMGDILDFDKSRTPLFLLEHRKVRNTKSVSEWEKHLSINGRSISSTQIEFQAECHSAEIHRCVLDFLSYIEYERKETMECIRKMGTSDHYLELNDPILFQVDSDGSYIYEDLDISFDYRKVLSILMGTELYSSAEVFLRELLQNAYDASFVRKELSVKSGDITYLPCVKVHYDSKNKILSVKDNGIGMDMSSIKNYVTKIGSSYYKSKEFQSELIDYTPISNFGIGILSCFMVSNSINIDSLRYSTNLAAREPINITLNLDNSFVERRPTSRTTTGTKISLYIHDKFAKELSIEKIQKIIEDNTAYQSIPIQLSVDDNQITLEKTCITVPEIKDHPGIDVIHVDNDIIEGYLILYGGEHQSLVKSHKICQQGFRINGKGGNTFGLKPEFLRFMGFNINIKDRLLSTKASREGVITNAAFDKLQALISDIILENYKDKASSLIRYIVDGTHNIISHHQQEFDFLSKNINYMVFDVKQRKIIESCPLFSKLREQTKVCKVAFLSPYLCETNRQQYLQEIILYCDFVVFTTLNMHLFMQLANPYCIKSFEVITDVPGLIYHLIEYDFSRNICLSDYSDKYSYTDINQYSQLVYTKQVFCYITNNQYNFLHLSFNKLHPWGKLFIDHRDDLCVKKASIVLKENIESAMLTASCSPLKKIIEYSGEYSRLHSNTCDHSKKTIGIFDFQIIDSINTYLFKTIDHTLLQEYGLLDKPLTTDDFISWWFNKEDCPQIR